MMRKMFLQPFRPQEIENIIIDLNHVTDVVEKHTWHATRNTQLYVFPCLQIVFRSTEAACFGFQVLIKTRNNDIFLLVTTNYIDETFRNLRKHIGTYVVSYILWLKTCSMLLIKCGLGQKIFFKFFSEQFLST